MTTFKNYLAFACELKYYASNCPGREVNAAGSQPRGRLGQRRLFFVGATTIKQRDVD